MTCVAERPRETTSALQSALSKTRRTGPDLWCGYLTPREILALVTNGAIVAPGDPKQAANRAVGKGNARWTHFKCLGRREPFKK